MVRRSSCAPSLASSPATSLLTVDQSDLDRLHDHVKEKYGRVDVIFANAGSGVLGPVEGVTESDFDRTVVRTWTTDLAPCSIRVNALAPGNIETQILLKTGMSQETVDGVFEHIRQQIPLKRHGQSDEIAKPALFLASDDSSYVTGIELTVDGGWAQV